MSITWRGQRLFNHCGVANAILQEASESYAAPGSLEEATELLADAEKRLDTIYQLAREIERMGMRMDDGLRGKGDRIEELEELIEELERLLS